MDQDKFGKIIKDLRKKSNLTQKDLADKLGVTYQAVSKWERGVNMPDIALIKQIALLFNINLEELLGEKSKITKKHPIKYIIILIIILLGGGGAIYIFFHPDEFELKKLSSTCNNFEISGSIAYNKEKSSIYISNINYCGVEENEIYKSISCVLYEKHNDTTIKISECEQQNNVLLADYVESINFYISDYSSSCKLYEDDKLYIDVIASMDDGKNITYTIPLSSKETCKELN